MYTPESVPIAHLSRPGGCWKTVAQLTAALQTGFGRVARVGYRSSTCLIARSRGVPLITTLLEPAFSEYPNAVSASTRNRKGSSFWANRDAACVVLASMILSHH